MPRKPALPRRHPPQVPLPPETLFRILRHLHLLNHTKRQPALVACTSVDRAWGSVASQVLWENPVVQTPAALVEFERLATTNRPGSSVTRGDKVRRLTILVDPDDTWSLPTLGSAAASSCRNARAIVIGPRTPGRPTRRKARGAWPLPDVARIFIKCLKLEAFELQFPVVGPETCLDDELAADTFWTSPLGEPMWEALGDLRALKLHLPDAFRVYRAIGDSITQWTAPCSCAGRNFKSAKALPLLTILYGSRLYDRSLAPYSTSCPLLVKVDLSSSAVSDTGVKDLLTRCPSIRELDLTHTEITTKTIITLKTHPPLKFLGIGCNDHLFTGKPAESIIVDYLTRRGADLERIAIGCMAYDISVSLLLSLLEKCAKIRVMKIYGVPSAALLASVARHMPSLRVMGVGGPKRGVRERLRKVVREGVEVMEFDPWEKNVEGIDLEISGLGMEVEG
ncbi:hypothetical protein BDK51DRAFT_44468 [Blyttiomyces helicus]|uniref:F-box domain-containing protein n=1 Tax=Blyttiomyces helicus TaxID=388810 RepID=A0A4V1IPV2_9FUNG|nr:hypothetical protein BDK51DRAFT_44468 [Blyttiomyces helicus]|eukprot:RKO84347.1 hypothetical protein BDK51DRAFT_44468 [Blyttiomyces helicus]